MPSPEAIAHAFVKAINAHDLDQLAGFMTPDHRFIDSLGNVVQSREKMRQGWGGYFRMVPDYTIVIEETFSGGDTVVLLGRAQGTYVKDGPPKPENFWQTPVALRARVEGDQIAEGRVYADNDPIRQHISKNK